MSKNLASLLKSLFYTGTGKCFARRRWGMYLFYFSAIISDTRIYVKKHILIIHNQQKSQNYETQKIDAKNKFMYIFSYVYHY